MLLAEVASFLLSRQANSSIPRSLAGADGATALPDGEAGSCSV
jgi:hypothetical protein